EDYLTSTTNVFADVTGLSVGDKPKFTIKHLRAALNSKSPTGSGEPGIALGGDTVVEGASVDGHALVVELAVPVFQQYDTRAKLLTASDDPEFVRESGDCLFMRSSSGGAAAPPAGRLQCGGGTIYATIVKSIEWAGDP